MLGSFGSQLTALNFPALTTLTAWEDSSRPFSLDLGANYGSAHQLISSFPALTSVNGLNCAHECRVPLLVNSTGTGRVNIAENNTALPNLERVSGQLRVWKNYTVTFPKLKEVGGQLDVWMQGHDGTFNFPELLTVRGGIKLNSYSAEFSGASTTQSHFPWDLTSMEQVIFPKLTTVAGFVRMTNLWKVTNVSLPELTS